MTVSETKGHKPYWPDSFVTGQTDNEMDCPGQFD